MPIYVYECGDCGVRFDEMIRLADYDTAEVSCGACGSKNTERIITPVNFNLPGDSWPSKNNRIAGQMRRKNKRLSQRQDDMKRDGFVPKLVPNVGGEQTDSWQDAKKLAKDKGRDTSGYDAMVRKENAS